MIRTIQDLRTDPRVTTVDYVIESLEHLIDAGHRTGAEVWVTPAQYTTLMNDETCLRRAGAFAGPIALSRECELATGIGPVRIRRISASLNDL